MFLQISDQALKASPYNTLAYGILVSVLIVAVATLWLNHQGEIKARKESDLKAIKLMAEISIGLRDIDGLKDQVRELRFTLETFINSFNNGN